MLEVEYLPLAGDYHCIVWACACMFVRVCMQINPLYKALCLSGCHVDVSATLK